MNLIPYLRRVAILITLLFHASYSYVTQPNGDVHPNKPDLQNLLGIFGEVSVQFEDTVLAFVFTPKPETKIMFGYRNITGGLYSFSWYNYDPAGTQSTPPPTYLIFDEGNRDVAMLTMLTIYPQLKRPLFSLFMEAPFLGIKTIRYYGNSESMN